MDGNVWNHLLSLERGWQGPLGLPKPWDHVQRDQMRADSSPEYCLAIEFLPEIRLLVVVVHSKHFGGDRASAVVEGQLLPKVVVAVVLLRYPLLYNYSDNIDEDEGKSRRGSYQNWA